MGPGRCPQSARRSRRTSRINSNPRSIRPWRRWTERPPLSARSWKKSRACPQPVIQHADRRHTCRRRLSTDPQGTHGPRSDLDGRPRHGGSENDESASRAWTWAAAKLRLTHVFFPLGFIALVRAVVSRPRRSADRRFPGDAPTVGSWKSCGRRGRGDRRPLPEPATGRDCSSSTTLVNHRGPPSMSCAELGVHGLNRWPVKCREMLRNAEFAQPETVRARHHAWPRRK